MRIIDADALSAFIGDLRSTLHKEQTTFRAMTDIEFNTRDYMLLHFQYVIDNAPTVCNDNYSMGYQDGVRKVLSERPKGEWKDHKWCSNCGCGIPTDVYGGGITEEEAHFCVECGARMEAENEFCKKDETEMLK